MRMKLILSLIGTFLTMSVVAQQSTTAKVITVTQLERKISRDIQLIDVRTPKEFKEGHIGNAVNIDVNDSNFISNIQKLNKNKRVYVYCRTGKRSALAAHQMDSLGFKKIYNLPVGYEGWDKEKKKD